jgi:hypothetical protein
MEFEFSVTGNRDTKRAMGVLKPFEWRVRPVMELKCNLAGPDFLKRLLPVQK